MSRISMPLKYAKPEYTPGSNNTGHVQMELRTDVTKMMWRNSVFVRKSMNCCKLIVMLFVQLNLHT